MIHDADEVALINRFKKRMLAAVSSGDFKKINDVSTAMCAAAVELEEMFDKEKDTRVFTAVNDAMMSVPERKEPMNNRIRHLINLETWKTFCGLLNWAGSPPSSTPACKKCYRLWKKKQSVGG